MLSYDYWHPIIQNKIKEHGQRPPSVSREQWERRDRALSRDGFLPTERMWLNQHSINSIAMKLMRRDRKALKKSSADSLIFKNAILQDYDANGWFFINGKMSPFKALEYYKRLGGVMEEYPDKTKRKKRDYMALK